MLTIEAERCTQRTDTEEMYSARRSGVNRKYKNDKRQGRKRKEKVRYASDTNLRGKKITYNEVCGKTYLFRTYIQQISNISLLRIHYEQSLCFICFY